VAGKLVQIRPKKLAPELRKPKPSYRSEERWYRRVLLRVWEDPHALRLCVQLAFVALCLWIGVEFYRFMRWGLSDGARPYADRPPGVEGFLPISALIGVRHWLATGVVNHVHPAALFILLAIVLMSLAVKKAFCSFLCPVGTLSEYLWRLGRFVYRKNLKVPRWLDYPLRSLKYLLLLFFLWAIVKMDTPTLSAFVNSPYNKVADIKMYLFFAHLSGLALKVLLVLAVLSLFIKNVWCRFLCPYGALLGIIGWLSPFKVTRNKATCIDCELCTRACPSDIRVHTAGRVWSDECTSCLECVAVCPVTDTLEVRGAGKTISARAVATIVIGIFLGVTGVAMWAGVWHNGISRQEYLYRFPRLDSPTYQHARGHVPAYGPTD
jgi:NAD-dependent dihydropyrimidine dehydrogenase PreA subunit